MDVVSEEARSLDISLSQSKLAYAYYDASDRLRLWNDAYVDLNFAIRDLIKPGAYFPDLLAELVLAGQIDLGGDLVSAWVERRIAERRRGATGFRRLSDGRTFIAQERHDEIGGTMGFWLDITNLSQSGALTDTAFRGPRTARMLGDPGLQDLIRNKLQVVLGMLELTQLAHEADCAPPDVSEAIDAALFIRALLDCERAGGVDELRQFRATGIRPPVQECAGRTSLRPDQTGRAS